MYDTVFYYAACDNTNNIPILIVNEQQTFKLFNVMKKL